MKLVLDPEGSAIDLAASPLSVEEIKVTPGKKKVNFVTSPYGDGAVPFGRPATDVMTMEISVRVDQKATQDEGLAVLREVSQLLDEIANNLPAGIPIEETPDNSATASTAYIVLGEVTELPREMSGDQLGWYHKAPFAVLTLICEPFYEGPEEEAGEAEGSDPVLELVVENVKGDVEAPALAIVTDQTEENFRYAEIGIESRYYDSDEPAPILIEGDEFSVEGCNGELVAAPEWAHSSKVVKATLKPYRTVICKTGGQPHIGQWRESLRFKASTDDVYVRLAWRVGDGPWGSGGGWVKAPWPGDAFELFLDSINVPQATLGGQRWEGRIEAYSESGATLEIDYLENMPAERWVQLRAPDEAEPPAQDTGATAPTEVVNLAEKGGSVEWATPENAKVSDNAYASVALKVEERLIVLGGEKSKQFIGASSKLLFAKKFGFAIPETATIIGMVVEYECHSEGSGTITGNLYIVKAGVAVGGSDTSEDWPSGDGTVVAGATNSIFGGASLTPADVNNAGFGVGLMAKSHAGSVTEITAKVDQVKVTIYFREDQELKFICASAQDLRIDHETAERYDSTGSYLAEVPSWRGRGLKLPVSGPRERPVRVVTKMRTADIEAAASELTDTDHRLRATYIPKYRFPRNA